MADEHVVQLLDTNTANQIAAGEVVEKPASVVKELVENALDAGATKIEVTTFAGGTEYIRVVDNGCGMNEANAKMAVLRHATSKLTSADDLLRLHTLGFRGEALPSIASVSNFTLLTRPQEEEFATSVHIDGGEQTEVSSTGAAAGTTVIVENLFFNVPARRKFLKTVATEGRYISELLTKLALSRPDVRFKLTNNDKEVLSTPGDGDLARTIRALYGKNVAENLLTVKLDDPTVQISGFIGRPTLLKGTRGWQTFFVNGRSIGSKMLAKAMDHAYQSQIPKSGFPFAVINITVDTASVDVNVHPQKSEIKFSDEGVIYRAMFKALTDALTRPMSAQKMQVQLLPDSELNAFVPASPKTTLAVHREPPVRNEQPAPCAKAGERLQRDSAALFRHNQGVLKEAEQAGAPSVEERLQAALASLQKREESTQTALPSIEKHEEMPQQEMLTSSLSNGYQEPVLAVHEARAEFTAQKAEPLPEPAPTQAPRETIAFTDTDSALATIWPIGQVDII
uniref:DNA mismatch repair endonuclease MutL n=1 Tax=Phascolarctobacterium succinatutens TaxID=626940 RepID=UPI0026EC52B8